MQELAFRCPSCGGDLVRADDLFACKKCGRIKPVLGLDHSGEFHSGFSFWNRAPLTMEKIAREMELPQRVKKTASVLLGVFLGLNGHHVRNRAYHAAAALVMAARREGYVITIKEMLRVLNSLGYPCKGQTLARKIGEMSNLIGLRQTHEFKQYVSYIIRRIGLDSESSPRFGMAQCRDPWKILNKIELRALKIAKMLEDDERARHQLLGKSPLTLSAGAVYVAAKQLGIREITQSILANAIQSHKAVIRKRAKMLRELMGGNGGRLDRAGG